MKASSWAVTWAPGSHLSWSLRQSGELSVDDRRHALGLPSQVTFRLRRGQGSCGVGVGLVGRPGPPDSSRGLPDGAATWGLRAAGTLLPATQFILGNSRGDYWGISKLCNNQSWTPLPANFWKSLSCYRLWISWHMTDPHPPIMPDSLYKYLHSKSSSISSRK